MILGSPILPGVSDTAPVDVDKSAAQAGTSGESARRDHKHDVSTATPVDVGTANAEGAATSLARSDHVHNTPFTAVQTALGAASSSVGFNNQKLTLVADPGDPQDVATKAYVDAVAAGLDPKQSVRAVAIVDVGVLSGLAKTIDNVPIDTDGMRVLLTAQGTATTNGFWVAHAGAWTRPTDFSPGFHAAGSYTFIEQGTVWADTGWVCNTNQPNDVVDANPLAFTQFSGINETTAGAGLYKQLATLNVGAHPDGSMQINADNIQVGVLATDAQHGQRGGGTQHATVTRDITGFMKARHLTHLMAKGPASTFASGLFKEALPAANPFPTSVTWWADSSKTLKVMEKLITRNAQQFPATIVWKAYDALGVLLETITDTYDYGPGILTPTVTRSFT